MASRQVVGYSEFFVTVNTHVVERSTNPYTSIVRDNLRQAVWNGLTRHDEMEELLVYDPPDGELLRHRIQAFGVEVAPRTRQIHGHFVLSLEHARGRLLLSGINGRFQEWFSQALGIPGVYVKLRLLASGKFKNYSLKNRRRRQEEAAAGREDQAAEPIDPRVHGHSSAPSITTELHGTSHRRT